MVNIQLNEQELQKLYNSKGTTRQGYYCEYIVKHITQQVPDVFRVTLITNKDNMTKGDIKYHRYNETHYLEVKKGKVWNTNNKACIDYKYTRKGSKGTIKYTQPYGLKYCWLYNNTYDKIAFVFSDKVYVIGNAQLFLDTVRYYVDWCIRQCGSPGIFEHKWYNKHSNFPIYYGLTGGITNSNKTYDTYTLFVDIEWFCGLHNIPYQVINFKVTNVNAVIHQSIMA